MNHYCNYGRKRNLFFFFYRKRWYFKKTEENDSFGRSLHVQNENPKLRTLSDLHHIESTSGKSKN